MFADMSADSLQKFSALVRGRRGDTLKVLTESNVGVVPALINVEVQEGP